jgi:predicted Rossmann-fold nucleotide-binding protein
VLANLDGFYDPLVAQFERGFASGFISPAHREIVKTVTSFEDLLAEISRKTTAERILP